MQKHYYRSLLQIIIAKALWQISIITNRDPRIAMWQIIITKALLQIIITKALSQSILSPSYMVVLYYSEDPIHISALKTLLLARSPVFYAMFAGELAEKGENPVIEVNDIEPQAFREMLR